ncbi:fic/DOC family protein [Colletotrichum kahawae]|uniref:Fic/DOC family protein n=1 Tax=Colletotrichum kahawae TaxID=34407 RepID=A0AAE0D429_COLKA|nr:fic/DOC family protein [Colletotrichum kahawae]
MYAKTVKHMRERLARNAKLKGIYAPFANLQIRGVRETGELGQGHRSEAISTAWHGAGECRWGGYRTLPVTVRSNPLAVFPYPQEVPACIRRFLRGGTRSMRRVVVNGCFTR